APTRAAAPQPPPPAPQPAPRPPAPAPSAFSAPSPAPPPPSAPSPARAASEMTAEELRQTRSSPVVRRIAAQHNVDIRQIQGTGISGRVTKNDILSHIETRPEPAATPTVPSLPAPQPLATSAAAPAAAPSHAGERVEVVPMSPIRKKTAEHMVLSKRTS